MLLHKIVLPNTKYIFWINHPLSSKTYKLTCAFCTWFYHRQHSCAPVETAPAGMTAGERLGKYKVNYV